MKRLVKLSDIQKPVDVPYEDGVSNGTTTYTSATAAFVSADVGKFVHGTDIPTSTVGVYIASVTNPTTIELSEAATGSHSANHLLIANREVTSVDVFIADIPMRTVLEKWIMIPTVALVGPSLATAVAQGFLMPGDTGLETELDVMSTTPDVDSSIRLLDLDAPVKLVLRVTVTGLFISALTAGEIEIHHFETFLR